MEKEKEDKKEFCGSSSENEIITLPKCKNIKNWTIKRKKNQLLSKHSFFYVSVVIKF